MRLDEIRTGLQSFLANAARSSYALVADRVYYWPWPQGATLPLIAIQRISSGGLYHRMGSRATPLEVDFQISAFSTAVAEAEQIVSLVLDDLDGLDGSGGALGGVTVGMVKALMISPELYELDSGLHHAVVDVRIAYEP